MAFVDKVQVSLQAGNGGNGAVSFRREKYVDRGDQMAATVATVAMLVFVASRNQNTAGQLWVIRNG